MRKIFVATTGNDMGEGTKEQPLKTLNCALAEVKKNSHKCHEIIVRQGIYEVTEPIVITDVDNLSISAADNESVSIIGGRKLKACDITPVVDDGILERLLPEVRGKVLQYDLTGHGVPLGENIEVGYGYDALFTKSPLGLFIDGKACEMARYPKNDWIPITEICDSGQNIINGDNGRRGGTFKMHDDRMKRWKNADNLWLKGFVGTAYTCEILPIDKLNFEEKTVTLGVNGYFGLNVNYGKRDFFVFNLLEEISQSGDYFVDRKSGILYFLPTEGYTAHSSVCVSVLTEPIITLLNCTKVNVSNLTFEISRKNAIQIYSGEGNKISNCTFRNLGGYAVSIGRKMEFTDIPIIQSERKFFEHEQGLTNRQNLLGGENHIVSDCHIYHCGLGGIELYGGYRPSLRPANNQVRNCRIHDCNRWQRTYTPLINLMGVGNVIANCELYNGFGNGILLKGNDHLIEYNELHHLCSDVDDAGAFYTGRNPSEQGNVLRYNYFHHIESRRDVKNLIRDGFGVFSVYIDDGSSGFTVYGNVFYRGGNWAIAANGGSDINVSNNIIIGSSCCIWHTDNQVGRYSLDNIPKPEPLTWSHSHQYYDKLLDQVDITKPPFSTRYSQLKNLFLEAGYPQRNKAFNNVVYQCLNFITTWHQKDQLLINPAYLRIDDESNYDALRRCPVWYEQKGNLISSELDFLSNMEKPDFNLINAEIVKLIPEFEPIPFDEIGVKTQ